MKTLLALLLFAASAAGSQSFTNPVPITLVWDIPINLGYTNIIYKLYGTTNFNLAVTNWPVLAVITNPAVFSPTQFGYSMPVLPGAWFFTMTSSNFWGESFFSNIATVPPLPPLLNNLLITR